MEENIEKQSIIHKYLYTTAEEKFFLDRYSGAIVGIVKQNEIKFCSVMIVDSPFKYGLTEIYIITGDKKMIFHIELQIFKTEFGLMFGLIF